MTVLAFKKGNAPELLEVSESAEAIGELVDSGVRTVLLGKNSVLVYGEEGRRTGMPVSVWVKGENDTLKQMIRGTSFICSVVGGKLEDIRAEDIDLYRTWVALPCEICGGRSCED